MIIKGIIYYITCVVDDEIKWVISSFVLSYIEPKIGYDK